MKKALVFLSLLIILCGCGEKKEVQPVKISVMTEGDAEVWNSLSVAGVEVDVTVVAQGKLYESVLGAEEKPNIICISNTEDAKRLDEHLLDMRDVTVSEYERAKMIIEGAEEIECRHVFAGEKLSVLPHLKNKDEKFTRAWLYRADIFEKHGLPIPETMDEVNAVCNTLKKEYKKSTPLVFRNGYYALDLIAPAWESNAALGAYYDFDNEKWRFGLSEAWAGNFVSFWATMYKGALIPQNYLSMTDAEVSEIIAQNRAFLTVDYIWRLDEYNNYKNQDWRIMPSPRAETEGAQNKIAKRETPFGGYAICDVDNRKNTAAISVLNEVYKKICDAEKGELTEQETTCRIAKVYTEKNINPARYLSLDTAKITSPAYGYEAELLKFLTGEQPMSKWEAFAEETSEDAKVKKLLSECKRAYNKAKE